MAGYLLPILTEIPAGLNCEELANIVYERLKWPDAVNDLSLPDPTEFPWAPVSPIIRVKFQSYACDFIRRYIYDDKTRTFGPKKEIFHSPNGICCRVEDE